MYSFSYLEPSVVPCPVLTVASWPAYRFLKRQVRWSGIPISFRVYCDQFLEISAPSPNLLVFSVAKSCPTLRPPGRQHTRLPCPSPTPRAFSNSCPLSQWCYLTISSSVAPFSCSQSFPASRSSPILRNPQLYVSKGNFICKTNFFFTCTNFYEFW